MHTAGAVGRPSEPLEGSSSSSRLTREQVVTRIIEINPTATSDFLASFSERSLGRYLDHLVVATGPRGGQSRWQRPDDIPAIMSRVSRD